MPGEFKLAGDEENLQHSGPWALDLRITAVDCVTDMDFVLEPETYPSWSQQLHWDLKNLTTRTFTSPDVFDCKVFTTRGILIISTFKSILGDIIMGGTTVERHAT